VNTEVSGCAKTIAEYLPMVRDVTDASVGDSDKIYGVKKCVTCMSVC